MDISSSIPYTITFELRYNYGFEYLDHTGYVLNKIISEFPEWRVQDAVTSGTSLFNDTKEIFLTFGDKKLALHQELSSRISKLIPIEEFSHLSDDFSNILIKSFNLREFSRIGLRLRQLFKTSTLEEAKEYIKQLKIFTPNLEGETVEEIRYTIVISEQTWKSRIAIAAVEQDVRIDPAILKTSQVSTHALSGRQREALIQKIKAQKIIDTFPQYAILVDIDSSIEEPPIGNPLRIIDFVNDTYNASLTKAKKYLGG